MANVEKVEFEFPDEASENPRKGGSVVQAQDDDVEIIDDTPEEDRNRKPMDEPPKEFEEDEIAKYDESVQKRIKHFTKGYHEERRAKESALREREEAIRIAQAIADENKGGVPLGDEFDNTGEGGPYASIQYPPAHPN